MRGANPRPHYEVFMTIEDAIHLCESTACENCAVAIEDREDCRTNYEKQCLHFPCFYNLLNEDGLKRIRKRKIPKANETKKYHIGVEER